ncbi:hypothetical protein [Methylobacter tundripaludum]|uniref:Uncharacterized protein n=1 Tax=Methylobacter tundripaludum (strain ATCC BAA-1195 / DSM 17260 / SV96) TaxID=697282 RepID=G3IU74_METTV|nr:hypothetical protein [Methylobacter tundripaludum]EGW22672.1 hypothetical protein Mettu_1496 [Methylobacter tundripaludum SV96]
MTDQSQFTHMIIIENSPIEFLIVGPHDGRDKVIVRSANAGLDLLGLAVESSSSSAKSDMPSSTISSLIGSSRQLNVVNSYPVDDLKPRSDARKSKMKFAWVGDCGSIRREQIQQSFERSLSDLRNALNDTNETLVEWSIAPVVFQCSMAKEQRLSFRRFFYVTLAIYGIAGLFALGYLVARNLFIF